MMAVTGFCSSHSYVEILSLWIKSSISDVKRSKKERRLIK